MIAKFPCENETRLRFYFGTRTLTEAEFVKFMAGEGLPAGLGLDPAGAANCIYTPPRGEETTAAGTRDGKGEYHIIVTPKASQDGLWWWRGQGLNGEGQPAWSTEAFVLEAVRAF